jgi:hypothetical protein
VAELQNYMQYGKLLCKNNITKYLATSEGNEAIQKGRGRKKVSSKKKNGWLEIGNMQCFLSTVFLNF